MQEQSNRRVTGHVYLVERNRGSKWYAKYRRPDGRQVQKMLGPAWTGRGRPPTGYLTERTAGEALQEILADARRGTLAGRGQDRRYLPPTPPRSTCATSST